MRTAPAFGVASSVASTCAGLFGAALQPVLNRRDWIADNALKLEIFRSLGGASPVRKCVPGNGQKISNLKWCEKIVGVLDV